MAERERLAHVEEALRALATDLEYPPTPSVAPAVTARLRADLAQRGARPPFPGIAVWPRRKVLALAFLGVLLLAGAATAARLAIGAIEIRVVPSLPPRPTTAESGPALGRTVTLDQARRTVRFPILLPPRIGPPAEVHVAQSLYGSRVVVLAWRPDATHPQIGGTPWGTILMELPGSSDDLAYKEVAANVTLQGVLVNGARGFWIFGPHDLVLRTPEGERSFAVRGNVLLWPEGGTTLRLETALERRAAVALAETIR